LRLRDNIEVSGVPKRKTMEASNGEVQGCEIFCCSATIGVENHLQPPGEMVLDPPMRTRGRMDRSARPAGKDVISKDVNWTRVAKDVGRVFLAMRVAATVAMRGRHLHRNRIARPARGFVKDAPT
jgi:hypothetical protein